MTVSIIVPVYNAARTLARCLESAGAQTFTDWELIAVDDASSDDSAGIVRRWGDPRVRLLQHQVNRGPGAARNTGLAAATGEYVALLDSDDEWLPSKLERQLAFLAETGCDACGCEYWRVSRTGEERVRMPDPPSWAEALHARCEFTGSTLLSRRACAEANGPMLEEVRFFEDWEWMLRFVRQFRYRVLPEPLLRYFVAGPRNARRVAADAGVFLACCDEEYRRLGRRHRQEMRSAQLEHVAVNALRQRAYGLGARVLTRSVAEAPWRKPWQLGCLALAAVDALFGTAVLHRLAGWPQEPARP